MPWQDQRENTYRTRLHIGFDGLKKRWGTAEASFTDDTLVICGHPVMERWEEDYMQDLAAIATMNGGRVLEVGFGMGISAEFIQKHDIGEHVVIEANKDVLERARQFAAEARHPVRLLCGFWEDVVPALEAGSFDGILFDTYPLAPGEVHRNHFAFFAAAHRLLKPGGVLTYYSDEISEFSPEHIACLKSAGFDRIETRTCEVAPPPDCKYWTSKTILSPIIIK